MNDLSGFIYDKHSSSKERAAAYRAIINDGASILESDRPIEVGEALKGFVSNDR